MDFILNKDFVSLGGQCGGKNYPATASKNCVSGSKCIVLTDYFSQCLPSVPQGCNNMFAKMTNTTFDWRNVSGKSYVTSVKDQTLIDGCNSW